MFMFVGQMGCEALNFLLKRWIKEERPKRIIFSPLQRRAGISIKCVVADTRDGNF